MIASEEIKQDFPVLEGEMNGKRLVYLDSAATTPKPQQVISRIERFYRENSANPGRGMHDLSERVEEEYGSAREKAAGFIGASEEDTVFTSGCTESINMVARSIDIAGDIILPEMSHHSNQLPWRRKCERRGSSLKYIPTEQGELDLEKAKELIDSDTGLVAVSHISNVFGCENPVKALSDLAHDNDALILVDGAQSVPRKPTDVKKLEVDFLTFSGHKMCGPTGIGGLYGGRDLLEDMEPPNLGGGMVRSAGRGDLEWGNPPEKFEAGTQNVGGAVGMTEAMNYLESKGREETYKHDKKLTGKMREALSQINEVEIHSPRESCILSFNIADVHPHDTAEILNQEGVAVRAGHHCAQLQMEELGIPGTVRASPYIYNTGEDVKLLVDAVEKAVEVFGVE